MVPEAPAGLLAATRWQWEAFWTSELAPFVRTTDLPALHRLYRHYDELERIRADLTLTRGTAPRRRKGEPWNDFERRQAAWHRSKQASERLIQDPRGGVKLNPLLRYRLDLEERINALEDRFGFNLQARQRLGLNALKAESLQQQNDRQLRAVDSSPDDDPRVVILDRAKSKRRHPARERGTR